ncbi:MAG: hypothetical protein HZA88_09540 [Verrucomicrobia bacterium]|nr:hypothetical protein [Verrucomicrobiota bacterium]
MRLPKSTALVALLASVAIESIPFLGLLLCALKGWSVGDNPFCNAMAMMNIAGVYAMYQLRHSMPGVPHVLQAIVHGAIVFVVQVAIIWLVIMMVMMIIRAIKERTLR